MVHVNAEKEVEEHLRRAAELERDNLKQDMHNKQEQEYHGLKAELERRVEQRIA